jgi:hypothetical protein
MNYPAANNGVSTGIFVAPTADTPSERATAQNISQPDVYLYSLALVNLKITLPVALVYVSHRF